MENETIDNAVAEEVVALQEPEVTESTESVETEVAPVTEEEVATEQSPEENSKFKELRIKYENEKQEAIDKEYSQMYGDSHGIHTKADYEKAVAKQKEADLLESLKYGEVDPNEVYNKLKENDPDFQRMKQHESETLIKSQLDELNNELKGLDIDTINSIDELAALPNSDKVIKYVEKGNTLSEAYFLANKQSIIQNDRNKIQQNTIKQIEANGQSSPGALSDTGDTAAFFTEEQVANMSDAETYKNLDLIHKSMKTWK